MYFRKLDWPLQIVSVTDASAANSNSVYPYEGTFIAVMSMTTTENLTVDTSHLFGGYAHCMVATGKKSKRICHSTSHGESLAFHGGMTTAELLALRFTELMVVLHKPRLQNLMELFDAGDYVLPVHAVTDCKDLLDLITGAKGIPADRSQRLCVLSIREERLSGRCRVVSHIPTQIMIADCLTKIGTFPIMLRYLTCGHWNTDLSPYVHHSKKQLQITTRMIGERKNFTEDDLMRLGDLD